MKREISTIGKEMLLFQSKMADKHKYKPIPIDLFTGNIRDKYEAALPGWCLDEKNPTILFLLQTET